MILPRHSRVVLWGLTGNTGDSFKHIWRHYAHALDRLQKPWVWLPDAPESADHLQAGDLVFVVDVASDHLSQPVDGVDYLLHNVPDAHPVRDTPRERCVYLQVWTNDCAERGESWGPVRRWDRHSRVLYQPWGTNLFAEEFHDPVFNGRSRAVTFVGSIWEGNGQGNVVQINELNNIIARRGLAFQTYVHVPDDENLRLVREARLAPAVAGRWQVEHNYLPCRVFKNVSYGTLGITNVPKFAELFGDAAVVDQDIPALIERAVSLSEAQWIELVLEQQQVVRDYTYLQSLEAIGRAFDG